LGDAAPENVVLLEVQPHTQKTRIDFYCTEELTGVRTVCLTEVIKRNKQALLQTRTAQKSPSSVSTTASSLMNSTKSKLSLASAFKMNSMWCGSITLIGL
jgi:hypothetical protein